MQLDRPQTCTLPRRDAALAALFALAVALTAAAPATAQQTCTCATSNGLGGCLHPSLTDAGGYGGEFAGSAAVAPIVTPGPSARDFLFVADVYTGFTFRYNADDIAAGTLGVLISPMGSAETTGLAYHTGEDRLYWAIEGQLVRTNVARSALDATFAGAAEVGTVDLEGLAVALFGEGASAGALGGLTYHTGRDTLWAVDIVHDVYFEVRTDGSLSLDGNGAPVHFFNPLRDTSGGGAFGNSITYVASGGAEFFDIPVGTIVDGRPTRVVRVGAATDGSDLGASTGIGYEILPSLIAADRRANAFPTGIAYFENSCSANNSSEYLLVHDVAGGPASILDVSADRPALANVADLACSAGNSPAANFTWRKTDYDSLQVFRRDLGDPASQSQIVHEATFAADTGALTDVSFGVPPDGTYEYSFRTRRGTRESTPITCVVAIGRGRLIDSFAFAGSAANTTRLPTSASGVTATSEHLLVADASTGIGLRYRLDTLEADGQIPGPIGTLGRTTGIAWHAPSARFFWLGKIGERNVLQSTASDGGDPSALLSVQTPPGVLRTPTYGDLAYDAARNQFWAADRANSLIHAFGLDGRFVAGSFVNGPVADSILGGGIQIVGGDDTNITIDLAVGAAASGFSERLVRLAYTRSTMRNPETRYSSHLARIVNARSASGLLFRVTGAGTQNEARRQFVVASDTNRIYQLDFDEARIDGLPFQRGDANNDGAVNISDPSFILGALFLGAAQRPIPCADAADANDDGRVEINDAIALFSWLFRGGAAPAAPAAGCGFEATPSTLTCDTSFCVGLEA